MLAIGRDAIVAGTSIQWFRDSVFGSFYCVYSIANGAAQVQFGHFRRVQFGVVDDR
jgi:hypothetical protein